MYSSGMAQIILCLVSSSRCAKLLDDAWTQLLLPNILMVIIRLRKNQIDNITVMEHLIDPDMKRNIKLITFQEIAS